MSSVMDSGLFEPLELGTLAEGKLAEQFQEQLLVVSAVFEEFGTYESNKDGVLTCKILCEIELSRQEDSTAIEVAVRATTKIPKPKRVSRGGYYAAGAFTQSKVRQTDLFPPAPAVRQPTPLRPAAAPDKE